MWLFSFLFQFAWAAPNRISSTIQDLSQVETIRLSPGLVSVIELPKPVTEVRVGNPGAVKVSISTVSPKEITLYLQGTIVGATNLIVRAEKRVYVFDIVPSRMVHQDFLKVAGTFGAPFISRATVREHVELKPKTSAKGKLLESGRIE